MSTKDKIIQSNIVPLYIQFEFYFWDFHSFAHCHYTVFIVGYSHCEKMIKFIAPKMISQIHNFSSQA